MGICFVLLLLLFVLTADGTRIVGGREAAPHSHPYMASLQIGGQHTCGGILVTKDFVLTAAHCAIIEQYTVVLGAHSLIDAEPTKQTLTAVQSISHPAYDGHKNDVMLLKLNSSAQLNEAVQTISLRTSEEQPSDQCFTTGWGTINDNNVLPNKLLEVNVTILSQQTCRARWRRVLITDSMVCGVGTRGFQGFCSGDSGGPLICDGEAAGVVSFSGRRCGNPRTPDVYMRLSSFADWITSVISN